ncbi:NAD(P)-binding protein [Lophiostoma macrostomum CBS 122681]|uniref:NAD(P)-binding protein n=1 Tax=Lophiostoma macrostomum CBS 122681 TaxID=1314788 RepID=A0A6A6TST6_9PLEO|nr:NAD(P)-binding protein [Lophiostoma macrostomum CBS 122681]
MSSKSVLITGCSQGGIGHALAIAFQKRGCTVFATARSPKKMADLEALTNVHLLALDTTQPESIAAAAKEVERQTGGSLDVLINNAGAQYVMPILDDDIEMAKALFEVNYWGTVRVTKAFAQMLLAAKGTVVNIGSGAGLLPIPFQSHYNASKAAMNRWSETLRLELVPLGVRTMTIIVGTVESQLNEKAPQIKLPSTSSYRPIEKDMTELGEYTQTPADQFADSVADDVLSGKSGYVFMAANAYILKWVLPLLPQWAIDRLVTNMGRGLSKMPRV